jgi:putative FmdB family regulatory protein
MPLYEYRCGSCGEQFEVMQKFSDPPLTTHERCGGPVERLLSAPAIQFKGSGWYVTDYARAGSGKKDGEGKKDAAGDKKAGTRYDDEEGLVLPK